MFKVFIKWTINLLEDLHNTLNEAYEETYGCEEVSSEFAREIILRKRKNKDDFIVAAMAQVTKDILKKEGYLIPPTTAAVFAEKLFAEAKLNNDIDELNNLRTKEN